MSGDSSKKTEPLQFELAAPLLSENSGGGDFGAFATLLDPEAATTAISKVNALEHLIQAMVLDQPFKVFAQEVLLAFMKAVPCEAGSILEFNAAQQEFFFRAAAGQVSDRLAAFRIPRSEGIVWHVAESRMPCLVDSVHANEKQLTWISKQLGFTLHSLYAVPIVVRGEVFAVLEVLNRVGEPSFTSADQATLQSLAQSAGKVIEARLMIGALAQQMHKKGEAA